jgi:hypothetical protein
MPSVCKALLDEERESVTNLLANSVELTSMLGVMTNSYKLYDKYGPGCVSIRFQRLNMAVRL